MVKSFFYVGMKVTDKSGRAGVIHAVAPSPYIGEAGVTRFYVVGVGGAWADWLKGGDLTRVNPLCIESVAS